MIHITHPVQICCTDEDEALKFNSFLRDHKLHVNSVIKSWDGKSYRFDVYNAGFAEVRDLKIIFQDTHDDARSR